MPIGLGMVEPVAIDLPFETTPEKTNVADGEPTEGALECFAHGLAHLIDELGLREAVRFGARAILAAAEVESEGTQLEGAH